ERDRRQGAGAGREIGRLEERHPSQDLGCAQVEANARAVLERPRGTGEQRQTDGEELGARETPGRDEPLATRGVFTLDVMERDGRALPRAGFLHLRAV